MGKTSKTGYSQKENRYFLKPLLILIVSGTLTACGAMDSTMDSAMDSAMEGALNSQQDTAPDCPGLSAHNHQVEVCVTVPDHEPKSIGTLQITLHSNNKQQSLELERDGTPEQLWLLPESSDYPVVILLTRSVGSGSYPDLQGLHRINNEYVPFKLAGLSEQQRQGYMGHDQFQVMDGQLYRRFPIYRQTDANTSPSGGQACFYYETGVDEWHYCSINAGE